MTFPIFTKLVCRTGVAATLLHLACPTKANAGLSRVNDFSAVSAPEICLAEMTVVNAETESDGYLVFVRISATINTVYNDTPLCSVGDAVTITHIADELPNEATLTGTKILSPIQPRQPSSSEGWLFSDGGNQVLYKRGTFVAKASNRTMVEQYSCGQAHRYLETEPRYIDDHDHDAAILGIQIAERRSVFSPATQSALQWNQLNTAVETCAAASRSNLIEGSP